MKGCPKPRTSNQRGHKMQGPQYSRKFTTRHNHQKQQNFSTAKLPTKPYEIQEGGGDEGASYVHRYFPIRDEPKVGLCPNPTILVSYPSVAVGLVHDLTHLGAWFGPTKRHRCKVGSPAPNSTPWCTVAAPVRIVGQYLHLTKYSSTRVMTVHLTIIPCTPLPQLRKHLASTYLPSLPPLTACPVKLDEKHCMSIEKDTHY